MPPMRIAPTSATKRVLTAVVATSVNHSRLSAEAPCTRTSSSSAMRAATTIVTATSQAARSPKPAAIRLDLLRPAAIESVAATDQMPTPIAPASSAAETVRASIRTRQPRPPQPPLDEATGEAPERQRADRAHEDRGQHVVEAEGVVDHQPERGGGDGGDHGQRHQDRGQPPRGRLDQGVRHRDGRPPGGDHVPQQHGARGGPAREHRERLGRVLRDHQANERAQHARHQDDPAPAQRRLAAGLACEVVVVGAVAGLQADGHRLQAEAEEAREEGQQALWEAGDVRPPHLHQVDLVAAPPQRLAVGPVELAWAVPGAGDDHVDRVGLPAGVAVGLGEQPVGHGARRLGGRLLADPGHEDHGDTPAPPALARR